MKISLKAVYSGGAEWEITYNGRTEYILGIESMIRKIESANEEIEISPCLGFEEHSQLIKFLNKRKSKK